MMELDLDMGSGGGSRAEAARLEGFIAMDELREDIREGGFEVDRGWVAGFMCEGGR
jgi:hypothetical protein